ncbi:MAG: hypothetical protein KF912_06005 [Phycisphaeraceae bacterium]|nr:hypothetical protein [Phycisphaeraceae bacterium]MBX3366853.1 hypothetical protein [Phycisphaeraceae bacterium]MCW5767458.1 hypothetical protein [Phycisphaeraceae bacterium]
MPGTRLAISQNCRVLGPRTMVAGVIFPLIAMAFMTAYEQPGRKGCSMSLMNHGPMWFCVA